MNRVTLVKQLKHGIITQERYDRMMDIIEGDELNDPDGLIRQANTAHIEGMIMNGLKDMWKS